MGADSQVPTREVCSSANKVLKNHLVSAEAEEKYLVDITDHGDDFHVVVKVHALHQVRGVTANSWRVPLRSVRNFVNDRYLLEFVGGPQALNYRLNVVLDDFGVHVN